MLRNKFRGKCTQSKKWVTGFYYYCELDRKHFILSLSTNLIAGKERQEEIIVDPETVGQYVRLSGTKNGKKQLAFEGDIIKNMGRIYAIKSIEDVGYELGECTLFDGDFEIIGNIHENPELLSND